MKRVFSLIILAALLFTNCGFAAGDLIHSRSSSATLAPAVVSDDIGGVASMLKEAEIFLQAELNELDGIAVEGISGTNSKEKINKAFSERERLKEEDRYHTILSPSADEIKVYFNEMEPVSGSAHRFIVSASVTKGGARDNYQFIFSTIRSSDGFFPVIPYVPSKPPKLIVMKDAEESARLIAREIIDEVKSSPNTVLGFAAGDMRGSASGEASRFLMPDCKKIFDEAAGILTRRFGFEFNEHDARKQGIAQSIIQNKAHGSVQIIQKDETISIFVHKPGNVQQVTFGPDESTVYIEDGIKHIYTYKGKNPFLGFAIDKNGDILTIVREGFLDDYSKWFNGLKKSDATGDLAPFFIVTRKHLDGFDSGDLTLIGIPKIAVAGSIVADIIVPIGKKSLYLLPGKDSGLVIPGSPKFFDTPPQKSVDKYLEGLEDLPPGLYKQLKTTYGGPGYASAKVLHELGAYVKFVGAVGDDKLGRGLTEEMEALGMDTSGIKIIKKVPTSTNLIFSDIKTGSKAYNLAKGGANEYLTAKDVTHDVLDGAEVLHLGGIALTPTLMRLASSLIARAGIYGVKVGWDTVVDVYGLEKSAASIGAMRLLDYITPSMDEAPGISGRTGVLNNLVFLETLHIPAIYLKAGSNGSYALNGEGAVAMPAVKGLRNIKATGGGDTFSAAIALATAKGLTAEDAIKSATVCGALTCLQLGGGTIGKDPQEDFERMMAQFEKQLEDAPAVVAKRATLIRGSASGEMVDSLFDQALAAMPEEYNANGMDVPALIEEAMSYSDKKINATPHTAFVFSKIVTFDNGLGILLPKLARAGINVRVVATNDTERHLVDRLNETIEDENRHIKCGSSIEEIARTPGLAKCYYFKLENEPEPGMLNVVSIPITVEYIVRLLGKVCNIVNASQLEMIEAARLLFARAA